MTMFGVSVRNWKNPPRICDCSFYSNTFQPQELVEGARRDPEFQSRLRVMDIDEADLQQWLGPGHLGWRGGKRWELGCNGVYPQDLATEPGIDFGDHAKSDQVEVLVICVPVLFVGEIEDDAIMWTVFFNTQSHLKTMFPVKLIRSTVINGVIVRIQELSDLINGPFSCLNLRY